MPRRCAAKARPVVLAALLSLCVSGCSGGVTIVETAVDPVAASIPAQGNSLSMRGIANAWEACKAEVSSTLDAPQRADYPERAGVTSTKVEAGFEFQAYVDIEGIDGVLTREAFFCLATETPPGSGAFSATLTSGMGTGP